MTNLERDQLLPTAPEVGFEVAMALACSWIFALHIFVSVCTLSIDIVATAGDFRIWTRFLRKYVYFRVIRLDFNPWATADLLCRGSACDVIKRVKFINFNLIVLPIFLGNKEGLNSLNLK